MQTIQIEITDPKAIALLESMETLKLIRMKKKKQQTKKGKRVSELLRGSISEKEAQDFNALVDKDRNEWN